jgi:hypothetical protein
MAESEEDDLALAVQQNKRVRKKEVMVLGRRILALLPADNEFRAQILQVMLERMNELSKDL